MPQTTTHNPNIAITIVLAASPVQEAGFSTVLLLVLLSTNSLNGERVVEYTSYDEAYTAQQAGYISAATLAAVAVAFSQSPKPESFKVGYVDDTASVAAVKASKALAGVGTGALDTVVRATTAGADGNNIRVYWLGDSGAGVTIEVQTGSDVRNVIIHYQAGVSTVGNVETAINGLAGANDIIEIQTTGTGATVLAAGAAAETQLTGGSDAVVTEGYDDGLAACIAADDDFYGVCIASREQDDIVDVITYVEASSKRMLFVFQDDDTSWTTSGQPAAYSAVDAYERAIPVYHTDDTAWGDVGWIVGRLVWDPDENSVPWDAAPVAGVAELDPMPSAAARLLTIANNCNLGLPYGGEDYVMDPGVNISGRPIYEVLTADWLATRLVERTSELAVAHSARGEKIVVDKTGQKKILAILEGLFATGVTAGHFAEGQTLATAPSITSADLAARRIRITGRAQDAVSARIFDFTIYASREAIA